MLGMNHAAYTEAPQEGIYIQGLFLEGCGWDAGDKQLCESRPKVCLVCARACECVCVHVCCVRVCVCMCASAPASGMLPWSSFLPWELWWVVVMS